MYITISLASNVANELVTGCSITERVKRLVGNEIELGMMIPTIESRASKANSTARPYPVRPRPFGVKGTNETAQRAGANGLLSIFCPLFTHLRSKFGSSLG